MSKQLVDHRHMTCRYLPHFPSPSYVNNRITDTPFWTRIYNHNSSTKPTMHTMDFFNLCQRQGFFNLGKIRIFYWVLLLLYAIYLIFANDREMKIRISKWRGTSPHPSSIRKHLSFDEIHSLLYLDVICLATTKALLKKRTVLMIW